MSAGAALDVVGRRAWRLPPDVLAAVVREHPRTGFAPEFRRLWAAAAAAVLRGRAQLLRAVGAFDLAIRLAPFAPVRSR